MERVVIELVITGHDQEVDFSPIEPWEEGLLCVKCDLFPGRA
jgi:hypothetical protein